MHERQFQNGFSHREYVTVIKFCQLKQIFHFRNGSLIAPCILTHVLHFTTAMWKIIVATEVVVTIYIIPAYKLCKHFLCLIPLIGTVATAFGTTSWYLYPVPIATWLNNTNALHARIYHSVTVDLWWRVSNTWYMSMCWTVYVWILPNVIR